MAGLTAGTLADALRSCLDAEMRARAAELGRRIRAEDGAAPVLELVARLSGAEPR
jgi:UDP:flavonoid glycosyltransferase YjiC (YdhE family)